MNLFMLGDFTLNSGAKSRWRLECDALTNADVEGLAAMIRELVGPFSAVEGVPRGGLRLADALRPFAGKEGPFLIVEDVVTTGGSITRFRDKLAMEGNHAGKHVQGVTIFARGLCPLWVSPLFQMPRQLWVAR